MRSKLTADDLRALRAEACRLAEELLAGTDVPLSSVLGRGRSHRIVKERHRIWFEVRWRLGLSLPEAAAVFDVDHTSILYAVQKCEAKGAAAAEMRFTA